MRHYNIQSNPSVSTGSFALAILRKYNVAMTHPRSQVRAKSVHPILHRCSKHVSLPFLFDGLQNLHAVKDQKQLFSLIPGKKFFLAAKS